MNNTMIYKDYIGSIEFSEADKLFYGKVLGINALISYEGTNADELLKDFHQGIDEYLEECKEKGKSPEIPYKGNVNVRLKPQTHRQAALFAVNNYLTLNSVIELSVENYLKQNAVL